MPFYAHTDGTTGTSAWQTLNEHLNAVAIGAYERAKLGGAAEVLANAARTAGLLHDLGKYRPQFQQYLRDASCVPRHETWHKQAGAARALRVPNYLPVAFAIAGHHGGMPDASDLKDAVRGASGDPVASQVWPDAIRDCPALGSLDTLPSPPLQPRDPLEADLWTRWIFSCLVDADWADTANYERRILRLPPEPAPGTLDAQRWLDCSLAFVATRSRECRDPIVAQVRNDVLNACLDAAARPQGLFSLTVPTGGGKTLSSMAFALRHSRMHGLRRVIYVVPYLSILEQNARVMRQALGIAEGDPSFFEHHSLAEPPWDSTANETERNAAVRRAENWDAPLIVTTSVQFYESLFANGPSRCRKLQNIARSVILLDECQTLPPGLVAPTCGMLRQVASSMGCTIVLCTATKPAFDHAQLGTNERLGATEIIPPQLDLFARLRRVHVAWPDVANAPLAWPDVARTMLQSPSALCVVNTRRAAVLLYRELADDGSQPVFHLSTNMCPAHRLAVLDRVKQRLSQNEPCYLVSTQLIEAGVDIDFPFVMRELAPLEAIIQAAGRCNREGLLRGVNGAPGGRVEVFRSIDPALPIDRWYHAGVDVLDHDFLALGRQPRIDDPADIQEYFSRLYHTGSLDQKQIQSLRTAFDFPAVSNAYRLITDDSVPVVVATWDARRAEVESLLETVRRAPSRANFRRLIPYQVNLRRHELDKAGAATAVIDPRFDLRVWYGGYDDAIGLSNDALPVV